jgi:hypothetical protein
LAPKDSSYKDWLGSSCNLEIEHSAQFAYLRKRFSEYIVATNHHRNAQIEVGINPDENGFSRPSPTTADLIIGSHFPPSLRIRNHSFPSSSSPLAAENELCTAKSPSIKMDLPDDAENRDPRLQKNIKIDKAKQRLTPGSPCRFAETLLQHPMDARILKLMRTWRRVRLGMTLHFYHR